MKRVVPPAVILAAALALTGCSSTAGGIGAGTATALQQEVRHVASLAAAHRYPAALIAASTLRSDLGAAVDTGRVPDDRAVRIRAALALVEADLRAAQRAAPPRPARTATRTPTATPTPTEMPTATPTPNATARWVPTPTDQAKQAGESRKTPGEHPKERWKKLRDLWAGQGLDGW